MAPRNEDSFPSSLGLNYYTNRFHKNISGELWLDGRRIDDNLNGLWRIHDKLYDLQDFIKKHPGGSDWIKMTKGTDITEAFETHHIKGVAEHLLSRYFVKEATVPRISPFTFHENGFYRTLKRSVAEELPKVPKHVIQQSKLFADITASVYLLLLVLAMYSESYLLGALAGCALTFTANISHNFIHQRNNFRMYYIDLSMMSSREFRISHILSHHLFPNTIHDLEIIMYEPVLYFLPLTKTSMQKYLSWIIGIFTFPVLTFRGYFMMVFQEKRIRINGLIPWASLLFGYWLSGQEFVTCLMMFFWIIMCCSFTFHMIAKTAAHHHPDIFHDGDKARPKDELDFGVHQLDAVSDRPNINGTPFLVLSNYGDHALHHLFPTLDHGLLDYLYPIFLKTCIEFGVEWKLYSSAELVKAALQQLAKDMPTNDPPQPLKRKTLE